MELSGKVALVTGAGKGIGKASALALAEAGADVVVNDFKDMAGAEAVAGQIKDMGRKAVAVQCNVGNSSQVREMARRAVAEMGKVDVLVNNAGIYVRHEGGIAGLPDEAWQQVLDVNLSGVFYCCREVVPDMIRRRQGGKIVNISSVQALLAHFEASAYQPAKAGVVALTKCLAVELAPHKINVNAIGPGAIASEGMGATLGPEIIEAYRRRIPWGARGYTKDIGNVVLFLASEASRYMTGQTLYVDGGYLVDSTPTDLKKYDHPVMPDDPDPR